MSKQDTQIQKIEEVLKQTTEEKIQFIANISNQVMSGPQANLPKIQNLLHLLDANDLFIAKVVSLSLTQIFKDIAPLYKIQKEEIELKLKQVIRKDERKILNYEYMLVTYYEKFLKQMYQIKQSLENKSKEDLRQFETVMLKSLTELYKNLFYFNFNVDIINTISKYMLSKNQQIQNICVSFIEHIFEDENFNLCKLKRQIKIDFNRKIRLFFKKQKIRKIYKFKIMGNFIKTKI